VLGAKRFGTKPPKNGNTVFDNDETVVFSHGMCPGCMKKNFPEYVKE
jgi:hypothetical protein